MAIFPNGESYQAGPIIQTRVPHRNKNSSHTPSAASQEAGTLPPGKRVPALLMSAQAFSLKASFSAINGHP
jgi:hypothetical protein